MLICLECREVFESPKKYEGDPLEYFGSPCREHWLGCPNCGGAYTTAIKCSCCGEYINDKYIETDNEMVFCQNCYHLKDIGD